MLTLSVVSETSTKITLSWTPVPGCSGYAFFADGVRKSNSWDPLKASVSFAKGAASYRVDALGVSDSGAYPPTAQPPPPPPPSSGGILWDGRATAYTGITAGGDSIPAGLGFIVADPNDIRIVDDPVWRKAWAVRLNSQSKNPGWTTQPANSNSAEFVTIPKRDIIVGQTDWFAQSILMAATPRLDNNSWLIPTQYGYPRVWSPPGAITYFGAAHWANDTGVPQFGFTHAGGTNASEGDNTDYGNHGYCFRPVTETLGKRLDIVAGVNWQLDAKGWWVFATRIDKGAWTTHLDLHNIPTIERVASEPFPPPRPVADKQGGYLLSSSTWGTAWEWSYLLRGLSRHSSRADAELSLA